MMDLKLFWAWFAIICTSFFVLLYKLSLIGRRPKNYPPGPPTLPIIGNLHQIPKKRGHLKFQKWAQEYGPIYSLMLGTKCMIVLSSGQAIRDLLDKRSGIYSSRPENYLVQNILSGGLRILLLEYGDLWKMIRKVAHRIMNVKVAGTYVPYQDLESKALLLELLADPDEFVGHIRRYTTSIMTQMTYGFRITYLDDTRFKEMFDVFDRMSALGASPTAALLDFFPLLQYLPDVLLPIRRQAKAVHKKEYNLFLGQFANTRSKALDGKSQPCFCVDLLGLQEKEGCPDDVAGYMSGSLIQAGAETTSAILVGFIQAMVIFPDVVDAAHKELDRVCGDRMPDLNDVPDLPYIRSCMKETLRWMPSTLLGVPHAVTCDDEYLGYKIPKGASVVYNVWAIHNDRARHPNPRRFDPSRWAGDDQNSAHAATNADVTKRDHFVFGAGRRLCQGMHIADRTMFLAISRLLWAFDFRRHIDEETGEEVVPDMDDLEDGLFVLPRAFKAHIMPREGKAQRAREEWDRLAELLDADLQWEVVPEGMIWRDYDPSE
ncbi:cytochrome P450 [Hypoxylon cercidicola]|nr:cytochrome P450 [Hypoxylon cercidicola]